MARGGGGFAGGAGGGLNADDLLPLLPRDGTRPMEADLDLFQDPSDPLHASTKRYVDTLVHSAPLMVGVFSAPAAIASFFPATGYPSGPIPPATLLQLGEYLVCTVAGTAPPGTELPSGSVWAVGDWLICAGANWAVIPVGASVVARQVAVSPPVHAQTNVQEALERTVDRQGDVMTGQLIATMFRVDPDNAGLIVGSGAAFYRSNQGPLIIRCDLTNAQPLLENNNGQNRRAILDALNGVLKVGDTMTGFLILHADPTQDAHAATRRYVDAGDAEGTANANNRVLRAGDTMTGLLILSGAPTANLHAATKLYVDTGDTAANANANNRVLKAGDAMMGGLNFGSVAQGDARDVSRHLALWGGGTTGFGINITGGHINIIAAANASSLIGLMAGTKTTPTAEVSTSGIHLLIAPTANNHATTKQYVDTAANRVLLQWTPGANYAVDQGVIWDGLAFRVITAINNAPATPDFTTIRLYNVSQGDYWRGVPTGWVTDNWVHLLTMAPYGSYRVQLDLYGVGGDQSVILDIAASYNAGRVVISSVAHNPGNFMLDRFRLSAQGGNANPVRLEAHIRNAAGSPDFKIFVVGFARQNNSNTTVIQKPPTGQVDHLGGTEYEIVRIESGSTGGSAVPSFVAGTIQTGLGGWIRFPHVNATNRDDGRISARLHSAGLNIVGISSEADDTHRHISMWGHLTFRGTDDIVTAPGFTCNRDNWGYSTFGGGWFYKALGSGMVIRKSNGNQQVQVENNDGSGRTPILVQAEADLLYAKRTVGVGILSSRTAKVVTRGNFTGVGNNPPSLQPNSNAIETVDGQWTANVFLPAIDYLPQGEPFFFICNSATGITIGIDRTSMVDPLLVTATHTAVFARHGNVWEHIGTVHNTWLPAPLKFNQLANSYTLPANRGTNGQVLQTNGDGSTSWVAGATAPSAWENHTASTSFASTSRLRTRFVQGGERIEFQCRQSYIQATAAGVSRPILLNPLPANKRPPYEVHGFGATGTTLTCVVITIDNIGGQVTARSLPGSPDIPAGNFLDFNFTYPAPTFLERETNPEPPRNGKANGKIQRIFEAIRHVLSEEELVEKG